MTPWLEEAARLLRLAERDYRTFGILRDHPDAPLAPTCFHAQQCVEKALKAVLTAAQTPFRRTHDLEEIANLLTEAGIAGPFSPADYRSLGLFAVELRYDEGVAPPLTHEQADLLASTSLDWARNQVSRLAAQTGSKD